MYEVNTKYGLLKGVNYPVYYADGSIKECVLALPNEIRTPYGVFIPQYDDDGLRRKQVKPVTFHLNGTVKNLPLQGQVCIETSIGNIPAEFISFYEQGSIHRVFPLDGKVTGFWTEEDEAQLAGEFEFDLTCGRFRKKFIGVQFYDNGSLKSITFWPKDTVDIQAPVGPVTARIGISLYPDGRLRSYEPAKAQPVQTPIGEITAYDSNALGIYGETNSLCFAEDGQIAKMVTSTNVIRVTDEKGGKHEYRPGTRAGLFNSETRELVPMSIHFQDGKVHFNDNPQDSYEIGRCTFQIDTILPSTKGACSSCDGCSQCG